MTSDLAKSSTTSLSNGSDLMKAQETPQQPKHSKENQQSDEWTENWGFPLEQLFKIATKFFRDNEGKVFHPSYNDRNHFLALVLQAKHGTFDPSKASPLGALDIVGRDRRQAWADLRDLSKDKAMSNFINFLNSSCPSFKPYVEAHKREKEERDRQKEIEKEKERLKKEKEQLEKEEQQHQEESQRKYQEEFLLQEEQRRAIKEALNKQTYNQFKTYAEQQYPNDVEQQNILILKLQEQHYEQYMQQIVQQKLISAMMNSRSASTSSSYSSFSPSEQQRQQLQTQNAESPLLKKEESLVTYQSTTGYSNSNLTLSTALPASSSQTSTSINYQTNISSNPVSATTIYQTPNLIETNRQAEIGFQEVSGDRLHTKNSANDRGDTVNYNDQQQQQLNETVMRVPSKLTNGFASTDNQVVPTNVGDNIEEEDNDTGEEDFEAISEPAQIWTNKDIKGFKESIRQGNCDGIFKVGQGEVVTIRVPTHPDGSCLFWEFATDHYDIGFTLLFEWNKNPGTQVSVQISDSEDDEDEEETVKPAVGGSVQSDPEKGSSNFKCLSLLDGPPTSVIVPHDRCHCHEEVYAGSHPYPGKGVYLLKFDNTYSIFRSKTLYYRVYWDKLL